MSYPVSYRKGAQRDYPRRGYQTRTGYIPATLNAANDNRLAANDNWRVVKPRRGERGLTVPTIRTYARKAVRYNPLRVHPLYNAVNILNSIYPPDAPEYTAPPGYRKISECLTGPPNNWNGVIRRSTLNVPANIQCLTGQAISGYDFAPGDRLFLNGSVRYNGFHYQYPVDHINFRHKNWLGFERFPNVPQPNYYIPVRMPGPVSVPYNPTPPALVPVPTGLPHSGYDIAPRPVELPWVDPWRDPYRPVRPSRRVRTRPGRRPSRRPGRSPRRDPVFDPPPSVDAPPATLPGNKPGEVVQIGIGAETSPGGSVQPIATPVPYARPRGRIRNTHDKKTVANPASHTLIGRVLSGVTEGVDIINAVWWALPAKYRSRPRQVRPGVWRQPTPHQKALDILIHRDRVDVEKAIQNLAFMQVQDFAIGKTSQMLNKNFRPWYDAIGRPVGFQFGTAL